MTASSARLARPSAADPAAIADLAVECLELEVSTYPKPGLVSPFDSGSHDDMDIVTFRRSAEAIRPYFEALAEAGARGCGMGPLRVIGIEAETAMLAATGGINTHRGAIFGLGLLCAAAGYGDAATSLGATVARRWGRDILRGPTLLHSHGQGARRRYGAGGARLEAASGFPSVYDVGVPALASDRGEAARVQACFALIAAVEDTNLLHRRGPEGLRFAQRAARAFLDRGGVARRDWRARAVAVHRAFVARRLSPGGAADLLAMSLFVDAHEAKA
jgi:triphosphoribosyl-dephospho-CoA synthase